MSRDSETAALADVAALAAEQGLQLRGAFHPRPEDGVPDIARCAAGRHAGAAGFRGSKRLAELRRRSRGPRRRRRSSGPLVTANYRGLGRGSRRHGPVPVRWPAVAALRPLGPAQRRGVLFAARHPDPPAMGPVALLSGRLGVCRAARAAGAWRGRVQPLHRPATPNRACTPARFRPFQARVMRSRRAAAS